MDVRASLRARVARSSFPRCPLAERHDRRHRRLAPQNRRDRSEDTADRLAIRPPRDRFLRARLPLQAGRSRPPARGHPAATPRRGQGGRHPCPHVAAPAPRAARFSVRVVGHLPIATARVSAVALPTERSRCSAGSPSTAPPTRYSSGNHQHCARSAPCQSRPTTLLQPSSASRSSSSGRTNNLVRRHRPPRPDNRHRQTRRHDRRAALRPRRRYGRSAAFLVGGYTGTAWATAIQRFVPGHTPTVVGPAATGLRYAGVATRRPHLHRRGCHDRRNKLGDPLLRPLTRPRPTDRLLPRPVAHGALVALGQSLYLIGGRDPAARHSRRSSHRPAHGDTARAGALPVRSRTRERWRPAARSLSRANPRGPWRKSSSSGPPEARPDDLDGPARVGHELHRPAAEQSLILLSSCSHWSRSAFPPGRDRAHRVGASRRRARCQSAG